MLWPHMKGLKQMIKFNEEATRDERSSSRASLHSVSTNKFGVDLILQRRLTRDYELACCF